MSYYTHSQRSPYVSVIHYYASEQQRQTHTTATTDAFTVLPSELLVHIVQYLSAQADRLALSHTCITLRTVVWQHCMGTLSISSAADARNTAAVNGVMLAGVHSLRVHSSHSAALRLVRRTCIATVPTLLAENICSLDVSNTTLSSCGCDALRELVFPRLVSLDVAALRLQRVGSSQQFSALPHIAPFILAHASALQCLNISGSTVRSHALLALWPAMVDLRTLVANQCRDLFDNDTLCTIATHNTRLEALHFEDSGNHFTAINALRHLRALASLRVLIAPTLHVPEYYSTMTITGLLKAVTLHSLTHLDLGGNKLVNAAVVCALCAGATALQWLNFKACTQFDDACLLALGTLPDLRSLNIAECSSLTSDGLMAFAVHALCVPDRLQTLVASSLHSIRRGDGVCELVQRARALRVLDISHNGFTLDARTLFRIADEHHPALHHLSLFLCELPCIVPHVEEFVSRIATRRRGLAVGGGAAQSTFSLVLARIADLVTLQQRESVSFEFYNAPVAAMFSVAVFGAFPVALASSSSPVCTVRLPSASDTASVISTRVPFSAQSHCSGGGASATASFSDDPMSVDALVD